MRNENVTQSLNGLLADATLFYQKLRAMHWLVEGREFFALHGKFEALYNSWADHIDDIAERILTVGGKPLATLANMLERARIKEFAGSASGREMVEALVADLEHIVAAAGETISVAENAGDRGTANLLDGIRDEQEKTLWMLKAWLA